MNNKEIDKKRKLFLGAAIGNAGAFLSPPATKNKENQDKKAMSVVGYKKAMSVVGYKKAIYKQASRSWKAHIGELSNEAIKKLKDSNILDHVKEYKGLLKGTDNIVAKHKGMAEYMDPKTFSKFMKREIKGNKYMTSLGLAGGETRGVLIKSFKDNAEATNGFMTIAGNKVRVIDKGKIEKGKGKGLSRMMDGFPHKKFDKKYMEALINRHEADELRFAQKSKLSNKNSATLKGEKVPLGNITSHISPKVIGAESVNTAVAPGAVKNKMMKLRNTTNEIENFKNIGFDDYGKSGKYNKRINAKMQKQVVKGNRDFVREFQ
jgi:hypothetical protein